MKKKRIIIASSAVILVVIISLSLVFFANNSRFRLNEEYYGESNQLEISKDEYEQLINDKKSFVVMIDKPGCIMTADMATYMSEFPENMLFSYYHLLWDEAKESSIHEYVKFTPSIAIIRDGKVVTWLKTDSDDDAKYYNNADALREWFEKFIIF